MLNFMCVPKNKWKPQQINMYEVDKECEKIPHDYYQDVCILIERDGYLEVVLLNDYQTRFFHRFIFAPDFYWGFDEEYVFDSLVENENMAFNNEVLKRIYDTYSKMHPDWQLHYSKNKPLRLLDHIRSCQRKGSAKELLYKAGLGEIASRINTIDEYNMIGKSPAAIFSGLNMRLLKSINSLQGVKLLSTSANREKLYQLQQRFSWMFEKELNGSLCRFLYLLLEEEEDIIVIAKKFKKYYKQLSFLWQEYQYENFLVNDYRKEYYLKELKEFFGEDLLEKLDTKKLAELYGYWSEHRTKFVKIFEQANEQRDYKYEYKDEKYEIVYPSSIDEFLYEAVWQGNCLMDYFDEYIYNETDIMFLRKRGKSHEPFITMEVCDGEIVQARGRFNVKPTDEVLDWIEDYADRNKLKVELHYD